MLPENTFANSYFKQTMFDGCVCILVEMAHGIKDRLLILFQLACCHTDVLILSQRHPGETLESMLCTNNVGMYKAKTYYRGRSDKFQDQLRRWYLRGDLQDKQ